MFMFGLAVGIVQIWLGFLGIEYLTHTFVAFLAVLALFFARIILPLTIGTYFGAVEVMGWEPIVGIFLAVPGFFFILPSMLLAAMEPLFSQNNKSNDRTYSDYSEVKNVSQVIEHEPLKDINPKPVLEKTETLLDSPKFEKSKTVLEYDPDGETIWEEIIELGVATAEEFLVSLEKKPKQDLKILRDELLEKIHKESNPYDDPKANTAFQKALEISQAAQDEFVKVFELVGDKLSPDQILEKIETKFSKLELEREQDESNLQIFLFKRWEEELRSAERSGDMDKILRVFEKLGYRTDAEKRLLTRPKLNDSEGFQTTTFEYENA